jgi:hypothetical protein
MRLDRQSSQSSRSLRHGTKCALGGRSGGAEDSRPRRRLRAAYLPNDDVLKALAPERLAKIRLLNGEATPFLNTQDLSEFHTYEMANFGDGRRTVGEIRDAVSAEYGLLAVALVNDYLDACLKRE